MPIAKKCARRVLGALSIAASLPLAAATGNFVVNGDFDTDLSGWQQSGSPPPTWAALDHIGVLTSGSALLENDAADASMRLYPLTQCITPPPGTYVATVHGYIASGQTSGRLVFSYSAFHGANCTGTFGDIGGQFLAQVGTWQTQTATFRIFNLPGASVQISLGIEKDAAGGALQGYFDAIVLDDHLFADGFEGP